MSARRLMLVWAICWFAAAAAGPALADDDADHDLARDLYKQGRIHSLAEILREVGRDVPGDVVAVALLRVGDDWVYRIQIVAADGRRTVIDIDAETAAPVKTGGDP